MKIVRKLSKALTIPMFITSALFTVSCTPDPGMVEAMNSASQDCRNLIGIEITNITDEQRAVTQYGGEGVYVTAVIPQHPASMAGLKVGDIIVAVNSIPVTDVSDALAVVNGLEGGRKYPFHIYRITPKPGPKYFSAHVLIEKVQERAIGRIS